MLVNPKFLKNFLETPFLILYLFGVFFIWEEFEITILQEQIKKLLLTKEQIRFWICKFRELDMTDSADREKLIDSFVNAIYVYDDKIVLTFNYKDSTITIKLGDLESLDLESLSPPKMPR